MAPTLTIIDGGKKSLRSPPKTEKYKPIPESVSRETPQRMESDRLAQSIKDKRYGGSPVTDSEVLARLDSMGCTLAVIDYFTKAMCPESRFYWISPAKLLDRIEALTGEYAELGAQRFISDLARGQMDDILHYDEKFAVQINRARAEYGLLRNLNEKERKKCKVQDLLHGCADSRVIDNVLSKEGIMDDEMLDRVISRLYAIEGRIVDELRRRGFYTTQTKSIFPAYERIKLELLLKPATPGDVCLGIEMLKIQITAQKFMEMGTNDVLPGRIFREITAQSETDDEHILHRIDFNEVLRRMGRIAAKIAKKFGEPHLEDLLDMFVSKNGLLTVLTGKGFEEKIQTFFATDVKARLGQRQYEK